MFVKIEDSYFNPANIIAVLPHNGSHFQGVELSPPNPNRCLLLGVNGRVIDVAGAPEHVVQLLVRKP